MFEESLKKGKFVFCCINISAQTDLVLKGKNNPDYYYTKSKVDPLYLQAEGHAVITQWYQMKNRIVEIIS